MESLTFLKVFSFDRFLALELSRWLRVGDLKALRLVCRSANQIVTFWREFHYMLPIALIPHFNGIIDHLSVVNCLHLLNVQSIKYHLVAAIGKKMRMPIVVVSPRRKETWYSISTVHGAMCVAVYTLNSLHSTKDSAINRSTLYSLLRGRILLVIEIAARSPSIPGVGEYAALVSGESKMLLLHKPRSIDTESGQIESLPRWRCARTFSLDGSIKTTVSINSADASDSDDASDAPEPDSADSPNSITIIEGSHSLPLVNPDGGIDVQGIQLRLDKEELAMYDELNWRARAKLSGTVTVKIVEPIFIKLEETLLRPMALFVQRVYLTGLYSHIVVALDRSASFGPMERLLIGLPICILPFPKRDSEKRSIADAFATGFKRVFIGHWKVFRHFPLFSSVRPRARILILASPFFGGRGSATLRGYRDLVEANRECEADIASIRFAIGPKRFDSILRIFTSQFPRILPFDATEGEELWKLEAKLVP